jgi:hypothetical protein
MPCLVVISIPVTEIICLFNKALVCLLLYLCICVTNLGKDRFDKAVNITSIIPVSLVLVIRTQYVPSIFRLANAYSVIRLAYSVVWLAY